MEIELTPEEVNAILQMINKSQVVGVQGMRVLLGLDAKLRQAARAQGAGDGDT